MEQKLKVIYTNADTLTNKMRELQQIVCDMAADIIMATEIKPKYSKGELSSQQFKLDGYETYTNIESDNAGKGVAIYIADHLVTRVNRMNIGTEYKECVWLELKKRRVQWNSAGLHLS